MPYSNHPEINSLSAKKRIIAFKITALDLLREGYKVEEIHQVASEFESDEAYEAAQGMLDAIRDFEFANRPFQNN